MVWDTSMTSDAAMWNGAVGELSPCVINNIHWIMYYNIRNTFGTNLPVDFLDVLLFYVLIYMFMFLMYCDFHA